MMDSKFERMKDQRWPSLSHSDICQPALWISRSSLILVLLFPRTQWSFFSSVKLIHCMYYVPSSCFRCSSPFSDFLKSEMTEDQARRVWYKRNKQTHIQRTRTSPREVYELLWAITSHFKIRILNFVTLVSFSFHSFFFLPVLVDRCVKRMNWRFLSYLLCSFLLFRPSRTIFLRKYKIQRIQTHRRNTCVPQHSKAESSKTHRKEKKTRQWWNR